MEKFLKVGKIKVYLVWFDSMKAKSSAVFIQTPDVKILIDPGAAVMQNSYPLSNKEKEFFKKEALKRIESFSKKSDIIIITHYHYDHHTLPTKKSNFYEQKTLFIKDPNKWINRSQFFRARKFLKRLANLNKVKFKNILESPKKLEFYDPVEDLKFKEVDKKQLKKGKKWLKDLFKLWNKEMSVCEWSKNKTSVYFADGKKVTFKNTQISFSEPLFHGIEYDRLGWVIMVNVEYKDKKVLYTSDLQGIPIKDYAQKIIEINPDLLIADGPATYLLGYLLNQKNLERAIENTSYIIKNIKAKTIIYDHHLLRDLNYKQKVEKIYKTASNLGKKVLTALEFLEG